MLYTASYTFKILPHLDLCLFRYIQAHSTIFSIIKAYWRTKHYWGIFKLIQAYSEPCATLACSQPCHIPILGIFKTGGILKTLGNFDQVYSEPCHSQNNLFMYYSAIFRHIQNLVQPLYMQKPGIFGILVYLEPFHNCK